MILINKNMEKKTFKTRSFLSIGAFLFFIILTFSGIGLHKLDYQAATFSLIYLKTLHTISAVGFLIFSIGHIWKNWKAIKSYMSGTTKKIMSKELFIGIVLLILVLVISWVKAIGMAKGHGVI